jgi:hypothetical protein
MLTGSCTPEESSRVPKTTMGRELKGFRPFRFLLGNPDAFLNGKTPALRKLLTVSKRPKAPGMPVRILRYFQCFR